MYKTREEHEAEQAELRKKNKLRFVNMTKDELFDYFIENARYMPDAPDKAYHIRFAGQFFNDSDTKALWETINKLVRQWRKELSK